MMNKRKNIVSIIGMMEKNRRNGLAWNTLDLSFSQGINYHGTMHSE